MRITSKGQVTVPAEIQEKAELLPDTEGSRLFGLQAHCQLSPRRRRAPLAPSRFLYRCLCSRLADALC